MKRILFFLSLSLFTFQYMNAQIVNTDSILKNIAVPVFPDNTVNIIDFGAKPNGVTDSRQAINNAIFSCSKKGGIVIVPAGKYFVKGSIVLQSNVNLHVDDGAEIIFSSKPEDYMPFVLTCWEGTQLYNYSPLVYAYKASNIAITGNGKLNGKASEVFATWRPQGSENQNRLRQMGIDQTPVKDRNFGVASNLPPSMIQFFDCKNILVQDIHIEDAPYWVIHPVLCNNVTVLGVTINSNNLNNDGCDPEYTQNVLIENSTFNVGDDAIAIKAGRDQDGWRIGQPSGNIIIRNCIFNSKCNGLCIGSEMSAGVHNVFMENVKVKNALSGIYFKSNPDRGGFIKNIWVRNIKVDSVRTAFIRFETNYQGARGGFHPTQYSNFLIENVKGNYSGECGFYAVGLKGYPMKDILVKNVKLKSCKTPYILKNTENVKFENVDLGGMKMPENPEETNDDKLHSW